MNRSPVHALRRSLPLLVLLLMAVPARAQDGCTPEAPLAALRACLEAADAPSVVLADAFITRVFAEGAYAHRDFAAQQYLQLLGTVEHASDAPRLETHLQHLALILPDGLREALAQREAGLGTRLVTWWRSQDHLPATPRNERLEEHLARVQYAEAHYLYEGALDARGEVHIRLGPPGMLCEVDLSDPRYEIEVRMGLLGGIGELLPNELWVYPRVSRGLQYLFVRPPRGAFRIGRSLELVPPALRSVSPRRAEVTLRTLEEMYRQLSLCHIDYGDLYNRIADFVFQIKGNRMTGGGRLPMSPSNFAQSQIAEAGGMDARIAWGREEREPRTRSTLLDSLEDLRVDVRLARFREEDGRTRAELYWGAPPGSLYLSRRERRHLRRERRDALPEGFLVAGAAVLQSAGYEELGRAQERFPLGADPTSEGRVVPSPPPQQLVLPGTEGLFHVAAQFDQYALFVPEEPGGSVGSFHLKAHVFRADSLQSLQRDAAGLEMSDLRPLLIHDEAAFGTDPVRATSLYPFHTVTGDTRLAFYFEVYGLVFGPGDEARYSVEVEVGGPGARPDVQPTATRATFGSPTRTARQYLQVDLSAWESPGDLRVQLRVEDLTTGARVERALRFRLTAAGAEPLSDPDRPDEEG